MATLVPFSEVDRLDAELVRLGRGASALRLFVGEALEALGTTGGHHELGFSSLEAYARERCERTGRWAADTRALARRLASLPRTREALRAGTIGWSAAELLARHVSAESEGEWLERARGATVRELRELFFRGCDADVDVDSAECEETRTLTMRATREDAWMFEGARKVAEAVAGPMTADRVLQALLAEGISTLLEVVPEGARRELCELERLEHDVANEAEARAAWHAELGRWREEAEVLCRGAAVALADVDAETGGVEAALPETPEALDGVLRRSCAELAERDLALGIVAESARKAEVWRRLGFASEAQYAHERVGVSLSSLKAKRILAARAGRVPELATAVSSGRVGYEAAYLLSRVVTPATVEEWLRRAERRTVKHLREEVEAAELLIRMGAGREQVPLDEACMDEFFELERGIASGDFFRGAKGTSTTECVGGDSGDGGFGDEGGTAGQMSGDCAGTASQMSGGRQAARLVMGFGRVTLRWVVRRETAHFWRALEGVFRRVSARVCRVPASFLRFLCENFCHLWLPALGHERETDSGELPEYFGVYRRDAFRCASPVCTRRDITPHHLHFRSRGGGDEDENVASLCVWCHLHGVHGGRIAAVAPASRISWTIGRAGTLRVEGRTRVAT